MQRMLLAPVLAVVMLALVVSERPTMAEDTASKTPMIGSPTGNPLSFSLANVYDDGWRVRRANALLQQSGNSENGRGGAKSHDYLEISDFFNVREANVNTVADEWELELEGQWVTGAGGDDDFTFTPNIKYGINDDMFIELEVRPILFGDGGDQGNGDTSLQLFYQFARETDTTPAFATWVEARFPTGDGSSKIDGELHFNLTKTLVPKVRGHLEGFVESANGDEGGEDEDRRDFQWGTGIGFDYQLDDATICTVNYLNRSSEAFGNANQQILELGGVRKIAEDQHLKFALDIGIDGRDETPDFGMKLLWSIEW